MPIQIDMFDVQLGAALLLQFRTADGVVRVLSDAGNTNHKIQQRLHDAVGAQLMDTVRLDLIIGTHYDADHLDGLVAVIDDSRFEIGEVWLPPVANDVDGDGLDGALLDRQLLGLQLLQDETGTVLSRYLDAKARDLDRLVALLPDAEEQFAARVDKGVEPRADKSDLARFFLSHLADARRSLDGLPLEAKAVAGEHDDPTGHADDPIDGPFDVEPEETQPEWYWMDTPETRLARFWQGDPARERRTIKAISHLRVAKAKEAINATSLNAVVMAVRRRKLKARFSIIQQGTPRPFGWDAKTKRFSPTTPVNADQPSLILLGPSDALVSKYRDRLPTVTYAMKAALRYVDLVGTTPSNELSYVIRFDHDEQRILVAGDAACVDFLPGRRKPYFKDLLDELAPLDVVQVAHHGGANGHFYRCLLAAGIGAQANPVRLLLSHEVASAHRPSGAFSQFVELSKRTKDQMPMLFTSQPREMKVRDVVQYFSATTETPALRGDVRLSYDRDWTVDRHVVEPPTV